MILFQRVTPVGISLVSMLGFLSLLQTAWNPFLVMGATVALVFLLSARLNTFQVRRTEFWHLAGIPTLFLLLSFSALFFLEDARIMTAIMIAVSLLLFFYSENVFTYVHLPAKYQAYSIEYLSLVLNVLSLFFLSMVASGLRMFLQVPLYLLIPVVFLLSIFVISSTFWVSKVEPVRAFVFALAGAWILGQVFWVISYLPTGFYTSAGIVAIVFYAFLGLTRAHFLEKLTQSILRKYAYISSLLLAGVIATGKWI